MSSYNPDQYTEQQSGLTPHSVENDLIDWIDPSVIAECILEEMADQEVPLTLANAKEVWLKVLESLNDYLQSAVDRVSDRIKC